MLFGLWMVMDGPEIQHLIATLEVWGQHDLIFVQDILLLTYLLCYI